MKRILALLLIAGSAQGATNLAVTCTGTPSGNACRPHVYAQPTPASWVLSAGAWKVFGQLQPSDPVQVATNDITPGSVSEPGNGQPGTDWVYLPASQVPSAPAGPVYTVTPTAGPWQLSKGTVVKPPDHASEAVCVAAARLDAISAKASGEYLCKTSTAVSVKLTTAPPIIIPPVEPPVAGAAIKWHPGNYAWYSPGAVNGIGGYRLDYHLQSYLNFIDSICGESTIKGIQIVVYPKALEGDTAGDYSPGFKAVDAVLAKLKSCNKRLMISYQSTVFGNFAAATDVWPKYWVDQLGLSQLGFNGRYAGMAARTWQRPTTERVLAMSKAYGARYNGDPYFEMLTLGETAIQVDPGRDGFSNRAVLDELKYLLPAARKHWPNTGIRVSVNDLHPDPLMQELIEFCTTIPCALGGPDIWPYDVTQSDRIFVGLDAKGNSTLKDYRDLLPWAIEAQWQSFGGQFTMQKLWDATVNGYTANGGFAMPSMKTKYLIWYVNESNGNASSQWKTGILPFIRSVNGAVHPSASSCPKLYPGCNAN
jgi:hypothetical protein